MAPILLRACLIPLLVAGAPSTWAASGPVARGKALAQQNCARCHAIGEKGASRNPKSPPFRTLKTRYPLNELEEALAEGIVVSHDAPEMPEFEFDPNQISDLIAYIRTLKGR